MARPVSSSAAASSAKASTAGSFACFRAQLEADLVGAGIEVGPHAGDDGVHVAPGDERVDEAVAAARREVVIAPAHPAQVVGVVRQRQVVLREGPPDATALVPVAREHRGLLDGQERLGPQVPARERRMLDRDEVRVGAIGTLGRQLEHARPEGREHDRDGWLRLRRAVRCGSHGVEIGAHRLDRRAIRAPAAGDRGCVADPEAEDEAARVGLAKRPGTVGHGHRIAGVDVGDARGHDHPRRRGQEDPGVAEELLVAQRLRDPRDGVAERLERAGRRSRISARQLLECPAPGPDGSQCLGQAASAVSVRGSST